MIEYFDFVKLYCVFNGYKYDSASSCVHDAEELADELEKKHFFEDDRQFTLKDFFDVLSDIHGELFNIAQHTNNN